MSWSIGKHGNRRLRLAANNYDNEDATDVMERHKAYRPIKAALKEKGIQYQTPYTKMWVHWDSGLKIYGLAEEAARDLNRCGVRVMVMTKANTAALARASECGGAMETHQRFRQRSPTCKREADRVQMRHRLSDMQWMKRYTSPDESVSLLLFTLYGIYFCTVEYYKSGHMSHNLSS